MRYIYIDEAGTSQNEPVTIVVGLIVHADKQLMFAESAIGEVLQAVPKEFRSGFIFHATEIWGAEKYRERWRQTDRLAMLNNMMALPRRLNIPISFAMVRRSMPSAFPPELGLTKAQEHHIMTFKHCIANADKYMRDHAELNEVATAVAEDVPEMRKFLKLLPGHLRDNPSVMPAGPDMLIPTVADKIAGYINQSGESRVSRIRRSIHFIEKGDDPLIQIADACAFGLRRYFSDQSLGVDFIKNMGIIYLTDPATRASICL